MNWLNDSELRNITLFAVMPKITLEQLQNLAREVLIARKLAADIKSFLDAGTES